MTINNKPIAIEPDKIITFVDDVIDTIKPSQYIEMVKVDDISYTMKLNSLLTKYFKEYMQSYDIDDTTRHLFALMGVSLHILHTNCNIDIEEIINIISSTPTAFNKYALVGKDDLYTIREDD